VLEVHFRKFEEQAYVQLVYTYKGMRNNEVHQNVLGPEIDISDVLDRETHTL